MKLPFLISLLFLFGYSTVSYSQINYELSKISQSMSFENEKVPGSSYIKSRTINYQFSLNDSILNLGYYKLDTWEENENKLEIEYRYRAPLNGIEDMYLTNLDMEYSDGEDIRDMTRATLIVKSLRSEDLFDQEIDGQKTKTGFISIPVDRLADTTQILQLLKHVKGEWDFSKNHVEASCEIEQVEVSSDGTTIAAISDKNLDQPITLNGSVNLDEEMAKVLKDIIIFEYAMGIEYKDQLDELEGEEKQEMIAMLGLISKEKNDEISDLIRNQKWSTVMCNGEKVKTCYSYEYFEKLTKQR